MNYIDIYKSDTTNGPGIRVVLWVSGCSHKCKECHNPQTWDQNAGIEFDKDAEKTLVEYLKKPWIAGLTLSGGDPLFENNLNEVYAIVKKIKTELPNKTIWLYSGFTWEDIFDSQDENMLLRQKIVSLCDVFVDGPFKINKKNLLLKWKGSENQKVIDVQKSLIENDIVVIDNDPLPL